MDYGPLGKTSTYLEGYDPSLLFPISRSSAREKVGITGVSEFGQDLWNAYEFSWLNSNGLPLSKVLEIRVKHSSAQVVESKSMKLYLNGFAQSNFDEESEVLETVQRDLETAFDGELSVSFKERMESRSTVMQGKLINLDRSSVEIKNFNYSKDSLVASSTQTVSEKLVTSIFRSLCPVTSQPDWASVLIEYTGSQIDHDGLLEYLVSYRNHQAFHETTIERIFADIQSSCNPEQLIVYGRFLRRGGIDINPFRSSHDVEPPAFVDWRQ